MQTVFDLLSRQTAENVQLNNRIEKQEAEMVQLEMRNEKQHVLISHLNKNLEQLTNFQKAYPTDIQNRHQEISKAAVLRTCEEIRAADPTAKSGYYFIDPDGQVSGDDPIYVFCDMATGTIILHVSSHSV